MLRSVLTSKIRGDREPCQRQRHGGGTGRVRSRRRRSSVGEGGKKRRPGFPGSSSGGECRIRCTGTSPQCSSSRIGSFSPVTSSRQGGVAARLRRRHMAWKTRERGCWWGARRARTRPAPAPPPSPCCRSASNRAAGFGREVDPGRRGGDLAAARFGERREGGRKT